MLEDRGVKAREGTLLRSADPGNGRRLGEWVDRRDGQVAMHDP